MKTQSFLLLVAVCGAGLTASAEPPRIGINVRIGAPAPIVVHEAPPQPVIETQEYREPAPGPGYVWIAPHHSWVDGRWVWVRGMWAQPPQPNAVFVAGRWDRQTHSWIESHWEIQQTAAGYYNQSPAVPVSPPPPPPAYPETYGPGERYGEPPYGGEAEIIVNDAPPPLRREVITAQPSRQHVWVAGYWTASHGRHEWTEGHWEVPPRGRTTWVAPRWEQRGRSYVFVRGYWR